MRVADMEPCSDVVGAVRLELMTSCMSSMRSNQLSYVPEPVYITTIFRDYQAFSRKK